MSEDPLDAIFDAPEELQGVKREMLAKMIAPFAAVDPKNGTFFAKLAWNNLTTKQKVLVYLLARLALSTKNPEFSKSVTHGDVEEATELPGGTVRPKVSELIRDRVVYRNKDGSYYVRPSSVSLNKAWAIMENVVFEMGEKNE